MTTFVHQLLEKERLKWKKLHVSKNELLQFLMTHFTQTHLTQSCSFYHQKAKRRYPHGHITTSRKNQRGRRGD